MYNNSDYYSAISLFSKAIDNDDSNVNAYLFRGHSYAQIGDFNQAVNEYSHVIERSPKNYEAYFYRGVVWGDLKQYDKAINDYNVATNIEHDYINAIVNRGWSYLTILKTINAERDFIHVLQLDNKNTHAITGLAKIYILNNNTDVAMDLYNKSILSMPNSSILYYFRGELNLSKGDCEKALLDFNYAINLKNDYLSAYKARGFCFGKLGDNDIAIKDFTTALYLDSFDVESYNNRAHSYYSLGKYDESLVDFNTAIRIDSNKPELFYGRSKLFEKMNSNNKSISDAKKSVELNPSNKKYKNWLKYLLNRK